MPALASIFARNLKKKQETVKGVLLLILFSLAHFLDNAQCHIGRDSHRLKQTYGMLAGLHGQLLYYLHVCSCRPLRGTWPAQLKAGVCLVCTACPGSVMVLTPLGPWYPGKQFFTAAWGMVLVEALSCEKVWVQTSCLGVKKSLGGWCNPDGGQGSHVCARMCLPVHMCFLMSPAPNFLLLEGTIPASVSTCGPRLVLPFLLPLCPGSSHPPGSVNCQRRCFTGSGRRARWAPRSLPLPGQADHTIAQTEA